MRNQIIVKCCKTQYSLNKAFYVYRIVDNFNPTVKPFKEEKYEDNGGRLWRKPNRYCNKR